MAHWIASTEFNYMSGLRETHYKCSECKKYLEKKYRTPNPDKCPSCGSYMIKKTDNLCDDCKLTDTCTESLKGLKCCKTTKCFKRDWAEMEEEE